MEPKTKLEIIGPYTPEHEGPYTLTGPMLPNEDYLPVTVHCVVDGKAFISSKDVDGPWIVEIGCIQNAREVPVAREFWVNEYRHLGGFVRITHETECKAAREHKDLPYWDWVRTIHLREVLPGDGE